MILEDVIYLTLEDILEAHHIGTVKFNTFSKHVDENCVERRVVEPQTYYFGAEQYPRLFQKASIYFYKICTSHCFSDGNKRTAILSTDLFLRYNGYKLDVETEELFDFALSVADHETRPSLDYVEDWLYYNSIEYSY